MAGLIAWNRTLHELPNGLWLCKETAEHFRTPGSALRALRQDAARMPSNALVIVWEPASIASASKIKKMAPSTTGA